MSKNQFTGTATQLQCKFCEFNKDQYCNLQKTNDSLQVIFLDEEIALYNLYLS